MSDKDEKKSSVIDPKDGLEANVKKVLLGPVVIAAVDAVNNSDFVKSGKAAEVKAELASGLEKAAKVGAFGILGYAAVESDFVKSGKAEIAREAVVDAVKNLPNTLGAAYSKTLYTLGTADAKITEAVGLGALNDLTLKACSVVEDVPVLRELSSPQCRGVKDVVAERGAKK